MSFSQDPVRDFFNWRYNAQDMYESITMYVLPERSISLNFTQDTVSAEDSHVFGLIIGNNRKDGNSEISLYNSIFPNRNSIGFNKSKPNKRWGEVTHTHSFMIDGPLLSLTTNTRNDMIASYNNEIIYITESTDFKHHFDNDQITLIQCSPEECSTMSYLCTANNQVLYLESPDKEPLEVYKFKRPVIDLSIDPFQVSTALVAQGKNHIHLIDQRENNASSIKMHGLTGSITFSPHVPFLFTNGLLTGDIGLYDLRTPNLPICTMQAHESEVTSMKWSPHRKDIIASCSLDSAITLWSISDSKIINSSASFVHSGHVAPISAFNWCKDIPWTLASISEDNLLEIWTIAHSQFDDFPAD